MATRPLTIYKASAGSGKTYTLTLRYITLLLGIKDPETGQITLNLKDGKPLQKCRHKYILAVTFTNKATDEMKQRIITELKALATMPVPNGKDAAYADTLISTFGCTREQLATAAINAIQDIIFDYSRFHVSTIDSFFQNVLRSMAFEFDRQGDYEITMDTAAVINIAIDNLLEDYNLANDERRSTTLRPLKVWLGGQMKENAKKGDDFNVFQSKGTLRSSIVKFVSSFFDENFADHSDKMLEWIKNGNVAKLKKAINDKIKSLKDDLKKKIDEANDTVARNNLQLQAVPKKILENKPEPATSTKYFVRAISMKPFTDAETFKGAVPDANIAAPVLDALNVYGKTHSDIKALEAVREHLGMYELQQLVLEKIEAWRQDNNVLLLSDAADIIHKFVKESDVPFIYERMGIELRHFLIDEFQDTSRLQWNNFKPLLQNGIDAGHDSLIIGDEKQSIYRFRNSDSSLLQHQVAEEFPYDYQLQGNAPGENTNYRSAVEIVRFNNTLFRHIAKYIKLSDGNNIDTFDNVIQDIPKSHADLHGVVRINIPPTNKDNASDDKDDSENKDTKAILAKMIDRIRQQHNNGYKFGDIAILTDTNNQASDCVSALIEQGIPVMSSDALEIDRARSVTLVLGIMRIISNLRDINNNALQNNRATRRLQASLMLCRFEYALNKNIDPDKPDDTQNIIETVKQIIPELRQNGTQLSRELNDAIESIIAIHPATLMSLAEMVIDKFVPKPLCQREMIYLSALIDYLMEYTNTFGSDLREFFTRWDRQSKHPTIKASGDTDAVNVVTIHSAKGLQYPCVHLPFMKFKPVDSAKVESAWLESDLIKDLLPDISLPPALYIKYSSNLSKFNTVFKNAFEKNERDKANDSINKAYVALTRPERELDIYVATSSAKDLSRNDDGSIIPDEKRTPGDKTLHADTPFDITVVNALADIDTADPVFDDYRNRDTVVFEPLSQYFNTVEGYKYGDDTMPQNKEQNTPETIQIDYDTYVRNDTDIITRVDAITRINDEADDDNEDTPDDDDTPEANVLIDGIYPNEEVRQAAIRGKILHEILSEIRTPDDINDDKRMTALSRCASAHYLRHTHNYEGYITELRRLLDDNGTNARTLIRWFKDIDASLEEHPMFVPPVHPDDEDDFGKVLRPDRIIQIGNIIEVIDFKFTKHESPKHHRQVAEYCTILRQIFPQLTVKGYLWYLDRHQVVPLKD